jgi:hypothetical protein
MKTEGPGNFFSTVGDLFGEVIDKGGDALGMSPEAKAAAKMGIGILTGNSVVAAKGAAALAQANGNTEGPAATEMHQADAATPPAGYCQPPCSSATQGRREVMKFDTDEVLNWTPSGGPAADNLALERSRYDLTREKPVTMGMQGGKSDYIAFLAQQLRTYPELRAAFEKDFGVKIDLSAYDQKGGMVVFRGDAAAAAQSQSPTPPPGGTSSPAQAGPATSSAAQSSGASYMDSNITAYQDSLNTLLQNWDTFDTAIGKKDCLITKENLEAISNFPNTSPELKKAAQFLIQHEEYFNRLEMACGVGGKDGIISQGDVAADVAKVKKDIAQYGVPSSGAGQASPAQATGAAQTSSDEQGIVAGGSGGTNQTNGVSNASSMAIEDRIRAVMDRAMSSLDGKIEELANAMGDNPTQKQMNDLQQLIERRTRMYTLMSDISAKFNEMSKTAIQNMARA